MRRLIFAVTVLAFSAAQLKAEVVIDYDTTIDYRIDDDVRIIEGTNPHPPTTVEIVEPGGIGYFLTIYDSSIVNMSGGGIFYMWAHDSSVVDISGGTLGSGMEATQREQWSSTGVTDRSAVRLSFALGWDNDTPTETGTLQVCGCSSLRCFIANACFFLKISKSLAQIAV